MKRLSPIVLAIMIIACSDPKGKEVSASSDDNTQEVDSSTAVDTVDIEPIEVDVTPLTNCISKFDGSGTGVPGCLEEHLNILNAVSPETADSLLYISHQQLMDAAEKVPIDIEWGEAYDDSFNIRPEVAQVYVDLGYHLDSEEGMFFLKPNWDILGTYFEGKLSSAGESYLRFKRDFRQKIAYDAGLVISPNEYADRLLFQEDILLSSPGFVGNEELLDNLSWEMNWVFFGMDNTPSHEWESRKPFDEWVDAWNKMAEKGGPVVSHYASQWLKEVEKNGGKVPEMTAYPYIDPEELASKVENAQSE